MLLVQMCPIAVVLTQRIYGLAGGFGVMDAVVAVLPALLLLL